MHNALCSLSYCILVDAVTLFALALQNAAVAAAQAFDIDNGKNVQVVLLLIQDRE